MGKHLWSYVLMALIAMCMVGLLALALEPIVESIAQTGKAVSTALVGTK